MEQGKRLLGNAERESRARRLIAELELADGRAERVAKGLSREQLNWSPAPGAWGIGQCLEHLRIGNELYLPAIAKALDGGERSTVRDVNLSLFKRWFIRNYIEPELGTLARSPTSARPAAAVELTVVDAFLRNNKLAREVISKASAYDVNRIQFANPFVPVFRFTVGAGLENTSAVISFRPSASVNVPGFRLTGSECSIFTKKAIRSTMSSGFLDA